MVLHAIDTVRRASRSLRNNRHATAPLPYHGAMGSDSVTAPPIGPPGDARSKPAIESLRIRLLGPFRVDGLDVSAFGSHKGRSFVKRLALARGRAVASDTLVEDLWGDHPPAAAARSGASRSSRCSTRWPPTSVGWRRRSSTRWLAPRPPGLARRSRPPALPRRVGHVLRLPPRAGAAGRGGRSERLSPGLPPSPGRTPARGAARRRSLRRRRPCPSGAGTGRWRSGPAIGRPA